MSSTKDKDDEEETMSSTKDDTETQTLVQDVLEVLLHLRDVLELLRDVLSDVCANKDDKKDNTKSPRTLRTLHAFKVKRIVLAIYY